MASGFAEIQSAARLVRPLLVSLLLACGPPHRGVDAEPTLEPSPCAQGALFDDWLSEPEAFLRTDQPKGLQGLHVACLWRDSSDILQLEAFKDAVRAPMGPERTAMEEPPEQGANWPAFRTSLSKALGFIKQTNTWQHQELKQPFGVFARQGRRLNSFGAALEAQLIFVVVGGQWFWPPVREGFVRRLPASGMELETLSVQPVVYQVRGFLKDSECEELVRLGEGRMESSPVTLMDKDKGKAAKEFRTSSQARLDRAESGTLRDIDARVGGLTGVPKIHNEEVQLLRYERTQYYSAHLDNWDPSYYSDAAWFEHGHNNRFITVFWYLTTVDKGGETIFPRAYGLPQPQDMYGCEQGLKVKPVKGSVIFWYSLHPNGNTDPNGLHGACPVEEGHKFSANYWVWNKPRVPNPGVDFAERYVADEEVEEEEEADVAGRRMFSSLEEGAGSASMMALAAVAAVAAAAVNLWLQRGSEPSEVEEVQEVAKPQGISSKRGKKKS